ncbi:MAG: hypothetical protein KF852_03480 [Saprospiraceae bacterium]|nr:hypothetical protein [Saprospiraceae bacterium]
MKTIIRLFVYLPVLAAITLASACNFVYFEKPVPQGAPEIKTAPAFLNGEYLIAEENGSGSQDAIMHTLLRFERLDDTHIAVGVESALPAGDLSKLKKALAEAQAEAKVTDYFVSEKLIYYTLAQEDAEEKTGMAIHLQKRGAYYRSPQWIHATYIFDLAKGRHLIISTSDLPVMSDLLTVQYKPEVTDFPLVAKGKGDEVWLSSEEEPGKWSLIYLKRVSDKELIIKGTLFFGDDHFKKNQAKYEAVTPFRKTENNDYIINPTDEQLKAFLADPELFGNTRLRKLAGK